MLRLSPVLFAAVFFLAGCLGAFVPTSGENRQSREQCSVEVLRPDIFEQGGNFAVGVFKAGSNAEATPILDRFSLNVLKGITDVFGEAGSRFHYVRPDMSVPVDFVIEGHVDEFRSVGIMNRIMFKRHLSVRIAAEVKEMQGGDIVALIAVQQKVHNDRKGLDKAGYDIGIAIGQGLAR